ncbi:hypothetical protein SISSUDRAFT_1055019 [Sistotremastrum suecicum HHB10207 ss-3]|nr:hypothetical protein SISSUDRAFT_1055019 [Sistotremastrum suecicum HHB10207 ss-3]
MRFQGTTGCSVHLDKAKDAFIWAEVNGSGSTVLYLPRSFKGPLFSNHPRFTGKLIFSAGVEENLTVFSEKSFSASGDSQYFIGKLEGTGYTKWQTWDGDNLIARTDKESTMTIMYEDELVEEPARS